MQTNIFNKSILAGMFISIGAIANVTIGGIVGAILFTFGLLSILHYKLPLYTGTAGFVESKADLKQLFVILIGNIIGCSIFGALCNLFLPITAINIVTTRIATPLITVLLYSIFCGFIMTTAVKFGREGKYLPTLFGVPLFICSGFIHSIADAFYFVLSPVSFQLIPIYLIAIIGNFIGCNLYRFGDYEIRRHI